ncbi:MAG TPA: HAMP domain-containing sensor histidine kinase [Streptosporangiaceae bacterium]|nr:HAMP domain-containing sensor histidine kinase [Streptosporangiaceae bacterium]
MRLRVILLVLAIGSLILVSFMLPLALLLRTFAADSAVSGATIRAQFMAPLVATLHHTSDLQVAVDQVNQQNLSEPVTIFMPSGQRIGAQVPVSPGVRLAETGKSYTEAAPGGVAIFVAVSGIGPKQGTAVVRSFVPNSRLRRGVVQAWLLLGLVAVGLLAMAVIVAAQLTRTLVRPLGNVASAAEQLAQGDLTARAPVEGPPEIRQVSNGLNRLAARIGELLAHERETLADLSHRLRTPLTALRIDAESLSDDEEVTTRVIGDVDALTRTVNEIIAQARRPAADGVAAACDATAVVGERAAYWRALAEDQERWMTVELPPFSLPVRVAEQDLAACVDILLENVFAHTPDGTAFSVRASPRTAGGAWIVVSDNGPGFSHPDSSRRGLSSAGSTGLGLDIARRIAEGSGGTLTLGRSPGGGGAVTIGLGPSARQVREPRRHIKTRRPHRNSPADDDELFGPPERFRAG